LNEQIEEYFTYYNFERRHQSINNAIPNELYFNMLKTKAA
jgi:transposase InsO family protein